MAALRTALEPLPGALALWQGGSAAFGRADAWSDLDLYVLAEEGVRMRHCPERYDYGPRAPTCPPTS